jgi:hypothetical protein
VSTFEPQREATLKRLRLIGAWVAFIAVIALAIAVFWLIIRFPRF